MPSRPKRPCRRSGCPNVVEGGGYCPQHLAATRRQYDKEKRNPASKKFYDSAAWLAVRAAKIALNPICEVCQKVLATTVHHLKELELYPELALVMDNLQSICTPCHSTETARANKRRGKW